MHISRELLTLSLIAQGSTLDGKALKFFYVKHEDQVVYFINVLVSSF